MNDSDWALVARARQGDLNGFAELVRRYEQPVIHFCMRMLDSQSDAEEVAQDAFVRVYRHLDRLQPQAKFSTFLFGVARNLALNAVRDARRRPASGGGLSADMPDVPDDAPRPDRAARLREIEQTVERGLQALSPEHREVLVLRELQGLDYDAIAQITGCRAGTVKSRIARAREQLRLLMPAARGDL